MAKRIKNTYRVIATMDDFISEKSFESYKKAVAKGLIEFELMLAKTIPDTLYHFTKKSNIESILNTGLKSGVDGGVFVGADLDELKEYLINNIVGAEYVRTLKGIMTKNTEELEDYVIIQFRPELSRAVRWYKRIDNHNILFYHGDLNITDVKLIELGGEHE